MKKCIAVFSKCLTLASLVIVLIVLFDIVKNITSNEETISTECTNEMTNAFSGYTEQVANAPPSYTEQVANAPPSYTPYNTTNPSIQNNQVGDVIVNGDITITTTSDNNKTIEDNSSIVDIIKSIIILVKELMELLRTFLQFSNNKK